MEHESTSFNADVVPLRARGQESAEQSCLKFFRAKQIAHRVSDASESELQHITSCSDCNARVAAFQRKHGNTPARHMERALKDYYFTHGSHDGLAVMLSHLQFGLFNAPHHDEEEHAFRAWQGTHTLATMLQHARHTLPPHRVPLVIDAAGHGLSAAAKSYILVGHSVDSLWPMIETMREGVTAFDGEHHLTTHYADLMAGVAIDSPITVRHLLYWNTFELFDGGEHAADVAGQTLNKLLRSEFADELMPIAGLMIHLRHNIARHLDHEVLSQIPSRSSPLIQIKLNRLKEITIEIKAAAACDVAEGAIHTLRAAFSRWFETASTGEQLETLYVVRAAFEEVFAEMPPEGEHARQTTHALAEALFSYDAGHSARPFYADIKIIETVRYHHPVTWSATLEKLLRQLPSYKHQGVVRCAVSAYDAAAGDASMTPHFTLKEHRWSLDAPRKSAIGRFWETLAALASESEQYADHIWWVSARLDAQHSHTTDGTPHRSKRARSRGHHRRADRAFTPEERMKRRS